MFIFYCILFTALFAWALVYEYREKHKLWTRKEIEDEFRRKNKLR